MQGNTTEYIVCHSLHYSQQSKVYIVVVNYIFSGNTQLHVTSCEAYIESAAGRLVGRSVLVLSAIGSRSLESAVTVKLVRCSYSLDGRLAMSG